MSLIIRADKPFNNKNAYFNLDSVFEINFYFTCNNI
jgi:hypothetical protein